MGTQKPQNHSGIEHDFSIRFVQDFPFPLKHTDRQQTNYIQDQNKANKYLVYSVFCTGSAYNEWIGAINLDDNGNNIDSEQKNQNNRHFSVISR